MFNLLHNISSTLQSVSFAFRVNEGKHTLLLILPLPAQVDLCKCKWNPLQSFHTWMCREGHKGQKALPSFTLLIATMYWLYWARCQWTMFWLYTIGNSTFLSIISKPVDLQVEGGQVSRILECEQKSRWRKSGAHFSFPPCRINTLRSLMGRLK